MRGDEGSRARGDTLPDTGYDATGVSDQRPARPLYLTELDGSVLEDAWWVASSPQS